MRSSLWDGMGRDFFKSGMEWDGMRFLCSGMGWDWDPTGMMKRIFSPKICGIIHLTSLVLTDVNMSFAQECLFTRHVLRRRHKQSQRL